MKKNSRRLLILTSLVCLLILLLAAVQLLPSVFPEKTAVFSSLQKETIQKIIITADKNTTELTQRKKRWAVGDFPADAERVQNIIDALAALKKDDIASQNKQKYQEFGVDGGKKIELNAQVLYVGKTAGYNRSYFRTNKDPVIYVANADFSSFLEPADFRDLKVLFIADEAKVDKVILVADGKQTAIEKKKDAWIVGRGKKAKKERVDFWINDIKTLKADEIFLEKTIDLSKTNPEITLLVKENNTEKKGTFYVKDKDSYYFHQEKSPYTYQIPASDVVSLKKEEKDLSE